MDSMFKKAVEDGIHRHQEKQRKEKERKRLERSLCRISQSLPVNQGHSILGNGVLMSDKSLSHDDDTTLGANYFILTGLEVLPEPTLPNLKEGNYELDFRSYDKAKPKDRVRVGDIVQSVRSERGLVYIVLDTPKFQKYCNSPADRAFDKVGTWNGEDTVYCHSVEGNLTSFRVEHCKLKWDPRRGHWIDQRPDSSLALGSLILNNQFEVLGILGKKSNASWEISYVLNASNVSVPPVSGADQGKGSNDALSGHHREEPSPEASCNNLQSRSCSTNGCANGGKQDEPSEDEPDNMTVSGADQGEGSNDALSGHHREEASPEASCNNLQSRSSSTNRCANGGQQDEPSEDEPDNMIVSDADQGKGSNDALSSPEASCNNLQSQSSQTNGCANGGQQDEPSEDKPDNMTELHKANGVHTVGISLQQAGQNRNVQQGSWNSVFHVGEDHCPGKDQQTSTSNLAVVTHNQEQLDSSKEKLAAVEKKVLDTRASNIPLSWLRKISMLLNVNRGTLGGDYRDLGEKMGLQPYEVRALERREDPTDILLQKLGAKKDGTVGKFVEYLQQMERFDVIDVIRKWTQDQSQSHAMGSTFV